MERRRRAEDEADGASGVQGRPRRRLRQPSGETRLGAKGLLSFFVDDEAFGPGDAYLQLLGYRDHGYDAENPESAQLILRLTSDPQAGMEWGDLDCLDIYAPKKDLPQGRFAKAYGYVGD